MTVVQEFLQGSPTQKELHKWRWYIRSMYWVVTTISTTGFGDITAQSLPECAVAIICIFCGAFLLSIILSQFTSGITSLSKYRREFSYQVKLLAVTYAVHSDVNN